MKEKTNRLYQFSDYNLEVDEGVLKKGETKIPLTRKAFEILVVLLKNHGRVVDKETLLNEVWADTYVEETTLAQNIFTIRKTLSAGNGGAYIETVPRRGYKFVADVTELSSSEEAVIPEGNIPAAETGGVACEINAERMSNVQTKNESRSFFAGNYRQLTASVLLLAAVFLISYGFVSYYQKTSLTETANAPFIKSIAVLPFQTIGEENKDEKVGFGMADAIITRLSKLQKIPVRPTTAIFPFIENPAANPLQIGRDLDVEAILEGTIQREGEKVRISVRLLSVADGKPLWAETFDEKSCDFFELQDLISAQVVRSLALKLTPEQEQLLQQRPTENPQAFEAYQMGVYLWNTRTRENLQKAETYFQKAVELDPKFGRAYGMLADTYHMIAYYGTKNGEVYEKARLNALKALALDDSVAEAHLAMAGFQLYAKDIDAARRSLEEAVNRAPYNSTVRVRYAWLLLRLGKIERAVEEMKLAKENDPLSPVTNGALCNMLIYRENYGEAVEVCRKAVDISAETADNHLALSYALFFNGETDDAIKQALIVTERGGEQKNAALGALGYFYTKLERRGEAEAIMRQLKSSVEEDFDLYKDLTLISYALGRKDEAFEYFKTVCERRLLAILYFRNDPVWKDIRQDSRFAALVEKLP